MELLWMAKCCQYCLTLEELSWQDFLIILYSFPRWYCNYTPPGRKFPILQRMRIWFVMARQKCCSTTFLEKHPLRIERPFWGGQSKQKWTKILEGARHIHKKYRMQKIWSKSVISALWSAESNLQRHIEGSHRALYFQSRSQRNIEQQCTNSYAAWNYHGFWLFGQFRMFTVRLFSLPEKNGRTLDAWSFARRWEDDHPPWEQRKKWMTW